MTLRDRAPYRHSSRRAVVAWGIAIADLTVFIASLGVWAASGRGLPPFDAATFVVLPVAFGGSGALLTARVPGNPIGPLLLAATTGMAFLVGTSSYALAAELLALPLPAPASIGILAGLAWIPSLLLVLAAIPLVFPDGRLLSRRWAVLPVLAFVLIIPVEIQTLFTTSPVNEISDLPNPFANATLEAAMAPLAEVAALLSVPVLLACWVSQAVRYRRAGDIGRHQIRWLATSVLAALVAFSIAFNTSGGVQDAANSVGLIFLTLVPVSIVIAITRYRLYDIDRLISRGIAYAVITIVLVVAYASLVIGLQELLGGIVGRDTVPVVISTLTVAGLFQPVRRRVQRLVDRRFDRARIDADETVRAFADRLRSQVDIDAVAGDLSTTVDTAIRPSGVSLWLRTSER